MLDLKIANAEVYDGSGAAPQIADVYLSNGKIAKIGAHLEDAARLTIDASGLTLTPGFIDSHTHSDYQLFADPSRWCKLKQGVTTEIGGQCGWSLAPYSAQAPKEFIDYITTVNKMRPFFDTFADVFDALGKMEIGANQACFVGHHYLRGSVLGMERRPATAQELDRMCGYVREAMQSGTFGLSTGLVYAPGNVADTEEVIALAKEIAPYGGIYTTHIRDEGDHLVEAVEEALRIGRESGVPVNLSHMKAMFPQNFGKVEKVLELIDNANAHGQSVTFDVYPYYASSSTILSTLPPSYLANGLDWLVERLSSKEGMEQFYRDIYEPTEDWEDPFARIGAENHLIAAAPKTPEAVGLRISEYAEKRGISNFEAYAELIRENRGQVSDIRFSMSDECVEKWYRHPMCMVGSDGLYRGDKNPAHVRGFCTATRYLSHYVRDRGLLPFAEGVRRLTGMPAERYGLAGKGFIREGYDADLVLFNRETFCDRATYANPFIPNEGIHMVFVAGKAAVVDNEMTGVLAGRPILHRAK